MGFPWCNLNYVQKPDRKNYSALSDDPDDSSDVSDDADDSDVLSDAELCSGTSAGASSAFLLPKNFFTGDASVLVAAVDAAPAFSTWEIACFAIGIRQFLLFPNSTITVSPFTETMVP